MACNNCENCPQQGGQDDQVTTWSIIPVDESDDTSDLPDWAQEEIEEANK